MASSVSTTVSGSERSRSSTSTTTRSSGLRSSDSMISANCLRNPCSVGSGGTSASSLGLSVSNRSMSAPAPGSVTVSAEDAASFTAFAKLTRRRSFFSASFTAPLTLSPKVLASSSFASSPPRTSSMRAVVGSVLLSYSQGLTSRQKMSSRVSKRRLRSCKTVVFPPPHGALTPTVTGSRSARVTIDSRTSTTSSKPSRSTSLGLSSRSGMAAWATPVPLNSSPLRIARATSARACRPARCRRPL